MCNLVGVLALKRAGVVLTFRTVYPACLQENVNLTYDIVPAFEFRYISRCNNLRNQRIKAPQAPKRYRIEPNH